ncbi:MAG: hypothetical protein V1929_12295 [bacterium]
MKHSMVTASVCVAAFAAVLTADARMGVNKNGDSVLTADEIATAYSGNKAKRLELFKQLDTDDNSVLSEAEVGSKDTLKKLDTNGDGYITQNEFLFESAKATTKALNAADSNDDGQIDESEAQLAIEKRKARRNK